MRPSVVVVDVLAEDGAEMSLAEDEDVVEALPRHASQEPFAASVHLRGVHGPPPRPHRRGGRDSFEQGAELLIAIADQKARRIAPGRGLAKLLRDPRVRGARHPDMHHATTIVRDDDEREDGPEPGVVKRKEVGRPDLSGMVAPAGRPARSGGAIAPARTQALLDGAPAD